MSWRASLPTVPRCSSTEPTMPTPSPQWRRAPIGSSCPTARIETLGARAARAGVAPLRAPCPRAGLAMVAARIAASADVDPGAQLDEDTLVWHLPQIRDCLLYTSPSPRDRTR